jgi:hypothetical protein
VHVGALKRPGTCIDDCGGFAMPSFASSFHSPRLSSRLVLLLLLLIVVTSATGCVAVAGIFKAGMWVGVILAVLVVGGAVALFSRLGGS